MCICMEYSEVHFTNMKCLFSDIKQSFNSLKVLLAFSINLELSRPNEKILKLCAPICGYVPVYMYNIAVRKVRNFGAIGVIHFLM